MNKGRAAVILLLAVLIYGAGQLPQATNTSTENNVSKPIADIKSKIESLDRSVIANYGRLTYSISDVQSSIGQVGQSVAELSKSAPELNGTVSSVYSPQRQLEGRLDSSYLALGVFLAVAVVVLVVVVFAWRRYSRQSAGGYDVCG
jgi:archaellum component FlaF (FlaF/FlaG flagellin family)